MVWAGLLKDEFVSNPVSPEEVDGWRSWRTCSIIELEAVLTTSISSIPFEMPLWDVWIILLNWTSSSLSIPLQKRFLVSSLCSVTIPKSWSISQLGVFIFVSVWCSKFIIVFEEFFNNSSSLAAAMGSGSQFPSGREASCENLNLELRFCTWASDKKDVSSFFVKKGWSWFLSLLLEFNDKSSQSGLQFLLCIVLDWNGG